MGLGFGNCYEAFPCGVEGFCRFLADGNESSEEGRQVGEQMAGGVDRRLADDFLHGERYLKDATVTKRFLETMPMRDIPTQYVIVKPLDRADPEQEQINRVTFFVDPDRLSTLAVLSNYTEPDLDNVIVPWAAACQIMGIFSYRELEGEHPRALVPSSPNRLVGKAASAAGAK